MARFLLLLFFALHVAGERAVAQDAFAGDAAFTLSGGSATELREAAMARAPGDAIATLMRRLTIPEDFDKLPKVSPDEAARIARAVEILDERASETTYNARMRVFFEPDAVRRLLSAANVRFAETVSKPVLVLPVFRAGEGVKLWDEQNPWVRAWSGFRPPPGLVPLIVPLGDLEDVTEIGGDKAIIADEGRLLNIAGRYGAGDVVIADATLRATDAGKPLIEAQARRIGDFAAGQLIARSYTGESFEDLDAALAQVAERVWAAVETNWKNRNTIRFGYENVLPAQAAFGALREWAEIRRRLEAVNMVRGVTVSRLNRNSARLSIAYQGAVEQLTVALRQRDLSLRPAGDLWELKLAAALPPAEPDAGLGVPPPGLDRNLNAPDRAAEGAAAE